jgi:hypothetical protein
MRIKINIIFFIALLFILTASCKRLVISVDEIPENTPKGQPIYIAGNFNNWDPGDGNSQLVLGDDSVYYFTIPPSFGTIQYKFTRGDWTTVEKGICGEEISNRMLEVATHDSASHKIESWSDLDPMNCDKLTILIEEIPENTPQEDIIAIASEINSWDPDEVSVVKKDSVGKMYVTINRPPGAEKFDYKLTRGDLSTSESDEFGNELPIRSIEFGKKDTVKVNIKGWSDLPETESKRVVFIIRKLPENTPENDRFFIASNLNSWISADENYEFQRNKNGQYFYSFPQRDLDLDFKITRKGWHTVEVDNNGFDISNRSLNLLNADTIILDIARWKDKGRPGDDEVTIVLNSIPKLTPEKDNIFLSGNFNNWNPGRLRHMFELKGDGKYYINLPRKRKNIEFRITRGSWETVQLDKYGSEMPNYFYSYGDFDSLFIDVENWKDKPLQKQKTISLILDDMPEDTPEYSVFYLAPDFNGWNPTDKNLIFENLPDGRPIITIPVNGNHMEYKITRGGWETVEVDKYGYDMDNRILNYGFADTVLINIVKWRDMYGNY